MLERKERDNERDRKDFFFLLRINGKKLTKKTHPRFFAENKINLLLLQRLKSTSPAAEHIPRSSASVHQRYADLDAAASSGLAKKVRKAPAAPSPTTPSSGDAASRKVEATKTPPGSSTRATSATASAGAGQQWIAAPAWTAGREPLAKGRRAASSLRGR